MSRIKGIKVTLVTKVKVGVDPANRPIYEPKEVEVDNVLISPVSTADAIERLNLTGKNISYELRIPKGDTNEWVGGLVKFFDKTWQVVGEPLEWIEDMLPLEWNKKVVVARNE